MSENLLKLNENELLKLEVALKSDKEQEDQRIRTDETLWKEEGKKVFLSNYIEKVLV